MNPAHPETLHEYVAREGGIMDAEGAAALLGVSKQTVKRWIASGRLPKLKPGRMPPTGVGQRRAACVLCEGKP